MDEELSKEIQNLRTSGSLRLMIEIIPNGVVMFNPERQIVLANRQAEAIFGYCRDDLLGLPMASLVPDDPIFHPQCTANFVRQPIGIGRDLFGRRKDGSNVPVEIGFTPLRVSEGLLFLSEIVDITVRKHTESLTLRAQEIKAQEAERCRLARELHDELGQLLTVINFDLEAAKLSAGAAAMQLDENIRRVHRAIEQVRNLTFDLRPPMLDELGLVPTLRWYADRHLQSTGLILHFQSESFANNVSPELATTCYRIVQEALANVIRHAHAKHVWIEIAEEANELRLSIRDDGLGFNTDIVRQRIGSDIGFGMLGMRERVEIFGGKFEIHSSSSQGTRIHVQIPLVPANLPDVVKGVVENECNSGPAG